MQIFKVPKYTVYTGKEDYTKTLGDNGYNITLKKCNRSYCRNNTYKEPITVLA